jgi:hypothetical protein
MEGIIMKRRIMILIAVLAASALYGCQARMNTHLIQEVPPGIYRVTLVETDYGCLNSFGNNCVVVYDVPGGRDLRLVYSGPKKELSDVPSGSIDGKGLIYYSITDDKGTVLGYLGFSEGRRAVRSAVFDNGSVVVGSERYNIELFRAKGKKD